MFPNENGHPLDPWNLDRSNRNQLKKAKIPWLRFHAFRRGVATNLHDAGANDLTIQRVLRHSDVSVTRRSYIKRLPTQAVDAMKVFKLTSSRGKRQHRPLFSDACQCRAGILSVMGTKIFHQVRLRFASVADYPPQIAVFPA